MSTTAAKKRKPTSPRRPATARVNGNGQPANAMPTAVPSAPAEDAYAPEQHEYQPTTTPEVPKPEEPPAPPAHPYGNIAVYSFVPVNVRPGDSTDPIVFPHITTLDADVEFFWELDALDPMHQAFRYMKRANVPRDIQRRVVRLPDEEMARFLNGWFMGVLMPQGVGPPGES